MRCDVGGEYFQKVLCLNGDYSYSKTKSDIPQMSSGNPVNLRVVNSKPRWSNDGAVPKIARSI
jgi:hypothetical protein